MKRPANLFLIVLLFYSFNTHTAHTHARKNTTSIQSIPSPYFDMGIFSPDATYKKDFDRNMFSYSENIIYRTRDDYGRGYDTTRIFTLTITPEFCRHDKKERGIIERFQGPHCESCKQEYQKWKQETAGTRMLLQAINDQRYKKR